MAEDSTTEAVAEGTEPAEATAQPKTFDETYVGNLRRESAGYRTKVREAEERLAALEAELTGARENAPALESRATAAEIRAAKLEVALEKGLSLDLVERLRGNTAEELAADADALLSLVSPKREPLPNYGGGSTEQPAQKVDVNAALRALARGK